MQQYSFVLLLAAYVLAITFPEPGQWTASSDWHGVSITKLLLALLLVLAGASLPGRQLRLRELIPLRSVLYVYISPVLSAIVLLSLLSCMPLTATTDFQLAVAIAVSMPIANTTIGWAAFKEGNLKESLGLLFLSTLASPLLSAIILWLLGNLAGINATGLVQDWQRQMPLFLGVWVILPILLGMALSQCLAAAGQDRLRAVAKQCSLPVLLVINYSNAALVLPSAMHQASSWLVAALIVAAQLAACWLCLTALHRRWPALSESSQVSVTLGSLMKNTGAALVFMGPQLENRPALGLTIIIFTVMQHLAVSILLRSPINATKPRS